jgi:hypothetical protein
MGSDGALLGPNPSRLYSLDELLWGPFGALARLLIRFDIDRQAVTFLVEDGR